MIINLRGTSGSGKSTLVKRYLDEHPHEAISTTLSTWKKPNVVAYKCFGSIEVEGDNPVAYEGLKKPTYIIGRYETACGGCDALSYKGSHDDIEAMVRGAMEKGNVIFEGLTISSTLTRWRRISDENPGQFIWAFMMTPVEVCYERILGRSGREPKRDKNGIADYQIKHSGCMRHLASLKAEEQRVLELTSDDEGYQKLVEALGASA